ncbi:MAG: preprotein translocase subunit SecG [Firmicutes bacterium]|nr:preprotein translocase subunit SecG [Bacillota bacterium]
MHALVWVFTVLIAVAIVVSVLLQSGRTYGLSGAVIGGAESMFGRRRGLDEVLARVTTVLGILFLAMMLLMGAKVV